MTGVLIEQQRQRDLEIWREEDEYIAPWRHVYGRETEGEEEGEGWRRGKSDRLDFESTHRRTLFNVSVTFLLSISSPPTLCYWIWMGWEEKAERRRYNILLGLHSRSWAPDKVLGQGSLGGHPIKRWDQVSLPGSFPARPVQMQHP